MRKAAALSLLLGVAGFALTGCYYDDPYYYGGRTVGTGYYASYAPGPYYGSYYGYPGYYSGPGYGSVAVGISSYGGPSYYGGPRYYRGYRTYRGAHYQRTGQYRTRSARTVRRQAQVSRVE